MVTNTDKSYDTFAFVLATAARMMKDRFWVALQEASLDISPAEARTLALADRMPGARQTELAKALGIEPMSLVRLLDGLEHHGLIVRRADPGDRRTRLVMLTEKAGPELARIRGIFNDARKSAMRNFSPEECALLHSLLQRLCQDLLSEE